MSSLVTEELRHAQSSSAAASLYSNFSMHETLQPFLCLTLLNIIL